MLTLIYATHPDQYFTSMLHSAKRYGYKIKILGWNTKWKGFGQKIIAFHNFLQNYQNKQEIILCVDAYDVLFCDYSHKLLKTYINNYSNVTFNAEVLPRSFITQYLWKFNFNATKLPPSHNKYKAFNAGIYIGTVHNIQSILFNIITSKGFSNKSDDQRILYKLYAQNKIKLDLDSSCKLFTAINEFNNDILIKNNRIYNNYTKTYPFLIHGPGNFTTLDKYTLFLQLPSNYKKNKQIQSNIKGFINNYFDLIFIIFIFIILSIFTNFKYLNIH